MFFDIPFSTDAAVGQLLNGFGIHFYDSALSGTLLAPIALTAPATGNTVTFTPSAEEWATISAVEDGVVRWFVKGWLTTGTYRTGFYFSSFKEFTIAGP